MNITFLLTTAAVWAMYSSLTIYGALKFPYFSRLNKAYAVVIVLAIPFLGAFYVNHDMGFRLSKEGKADIAYELPWWASIGTGASGSQMGDD